MRFAWRRREAFMEGILTLPGLALIIPLWVVPLAVLVVFSFFTNIMGGGFAAKFTFQNYVKVFTDPFYLSILYRTAMIAISVTIVSIIVGYPVAYKLARIDPRRASVYLILIIVPFLTAVIFRAFGLIYLLGNKGVINSFLGWLGVGQINLIWNRMSVIIGFVNVLLPYMILALYSSIAQVDKSMEEAAATLGASGLKTTWYIILPLIKSGVITGGIFVFAISMGTFEIPAVLGGMGEMVMPMLIQQYVSNMNYPGASALSLVLLAFVLLAIFVSTRILGGRLEL